jgi:predicted ATP-dependent endonuclease of OLD family
MVHISSAHIEGYKSIKNADVTFSPGLNIVIGKNGAGKSNLLNVLEGLSTFTPSKH